MAADEQRARALREALRVAPDDVGLRRLLAETLLASGDAADAERELRVARSLAPHDADVTVLLARTLHAAGRAPEALELLDELVQDIIPAGDVHLLHARVLHASAEPARALRAYRLAVRADARLADADFERALVREQGGARAEPPREMPAAFDAEGAFRALEDDDEDAPGEPEPPPASRVDRAERPMISFRDIGGMDAVKEEIRMKIIHPLTHPDLYAAYGKTAGGGILLYGPPGCGKTHLARATAGEIEAGFLSVGISDVLDMWIGQSEKNLHELFVQARSEAPSVLFFDEVDALAASRSDMRGHAGRHVINQFLTELDGVGADNAGVLVMAATNAPWHVDAAFRRPGRFDRMLFVPPPDTPAREAILRVMLAGKPAGDVDCAAVAKKTEGFSGADLKGVVDQAIEEKLREAMKSGRLAPLGTRDLLGAAKAAKPSTREWFQTARNYVLYANHGGFYDAVKPYL